MTISGLWHCMLNFEGHSKFSALADPINTIPIVANLIFWTCFRNVADFSHRLFIVPLDSIRRQSGSLTHFALGRFWEWGWRCSLPGCYGSQIFDCETVATSHFVQNWAANMVLKDLFRCDWYNSFLFKRQPAESALWDECLIVMEIHVNEPFF